jgi:hypothetical protein
LDEKRDYHLRQLTSAGIDPAAASQAGQFDLRINTEAYLREGPFDPDRMLEVFERIVTENSKGPYPVSRIVCRIDWAAEGLLHEFREPKGLRG